jgi:hypothetical protein
MLLTDLIKPEMFLRIDIGKNDIIGELTHCLKAIIARGEEINAETVFLQCKDQKILAEFMRIDYEIVYREHLKRIHSLEPI